MFLGEYNRDSAFSIGDQEAHVPHSVRTTQNQQAFGATYRDTVFSTQPDTEAQKASTRRINAGQIYTVDVFSVLLLV